MCRYIERQAKEEGSEAQCCQRKVVELRGSGRGRNWNSA